MIITMTIVIINKITTIIIKKIIMIKYHYSYYQFLLIKLINKGYIMLERLIIIYKAVNHNTTLYDFEI